MKLACPICFILEVLERRNPFRNILRVKNYRHQCLLCKDDDRTEATKRNEEKDLQ